MQFNRNAGAELTLLSVLLLKYNGSFIASGLYHIYIFVFFPPRSRNSCVVMHLYIRCTHVHIFTMNFLIQNGASAMDKCSKIAIRKIMCNEIQLPKLTECKTNLRMWKTISLITIACLPLPEFKQWHLVSFYYFRNLMCVMSHESSSTMFAIEIDEPNVKECVNHLFHFTFIFCSSHQG